MAIAPDFEYYCRVCKQHKYYKENQFVQICEGCLENLEKAQRRKVNAIVGVLKMHEYELSDGFENYCVVESVADSLKDIAEEILTKLKWV